MNLVEKEEVIFVKYYKRKKKYDWADKSLCIYKDKNKNGIGMMTISTFKER